jgi:type IV secretory pathway VirD2 relaxase
MDDALKIKMPYEHFKIRPGGTKKNRAESNLALPAALCYLLKGLNQKRRDVTHFAGKRDYYSTQRSTVKVKYVYNEYKDHSFNKVYAEQWAAHGRYLQRKGAQLEDKKGFGFDQTQEEIAIEKLLKSWQKEGDEHIWKLIISPEKAADINLKEHIRELMRTVENDLGTKLQWVAIDHYNTLHFHVHLVIRGVRDDGSVLRLSKEYFTTGFRSRSQQILTEKLGLRTGQDILESRQKIINARHITEIDREINNKLTNDHFINLDWCTKNGYLYQKNLQIKLRLEYLEKLGLAKEFTSASWHVDPTFLDYLKFVQEQDDIIKSQRKHYTQIIDKDLPTIVNKLPNFGDSIVGRVVGTGLSERDEEFRYVFIEGIDGQIHYVKANSKTIRIRDNHELFAGDIIYMERTKFAKDNKEISYIKVETFNDFESLRTAPEITNIDRYIIDRTIKNGFIPEISPTANAVRVEFMKIVHSRVDRLRRMGILNDRLEVDRTRLEQEMQFKRRIG